MQEDILATTDTGSVGPIKATRETVHSSMGLVAGIDASTTLGSITIDHSLHTFGKCSMQPFTITLWYCNACRPY